MKAWQASEYALAKRLGGKRTGYTEVAQEDVSHERISIEIKTRRRLPGWLFQAVAQAVRNAPVGKTPIVILHEIGQRHNIDLVVLTFRDFETCLLDGLVQGKPERVLQP